MNLQPCGQCGLEYDADTRNTLCPHYKQKTRQVEGRDTERRILRQRGARQHPMSGAGSIKEDGSTADALIEVKDANLSYSLKGEDLSDTYKRAVRQGKTGTWIIKFSNGIVANITLTKERTPDGL